MPIARAMNDAGNPDIATLNSVHDPVRAENDFTAGNITDFGNYSTRFGEVA